MERGSLIVAALAALLGAVVQPAFADDVKITPLGSHDGEFCAYDRALILEDPDGTRILYDAGRTVRGPDDPRLGRIDGVLLSHVHNDHLGDVHSATANAGTCDKPEFAVKDTPSSNTEKIVVAEMVKPNAVIASHANEAATKGGKLLPNSKTAALKAAVHVPVYLPLSGRTIDFDADGRCTGGC